MKWAEMLVAPEETLSLHYHTCLALADNTMSLRGSVKRMGYLMTQVSMCENAAKKRGIKL